MKSPTTVGVSVLSSEILKGGEELLSTPEKLPQQYDRASANCWGFPPHRNDPAVKGKKSKRYQKLSPNVTSINNFKIFLESSV